MSTLIAILLWLATFPVSVIGYNAYVAHSMSRDLPRLARSPETGILKGAEPLFLKGEARKAALLVHGFNGSPTDFGRLPQRLQEAGYTVSVPLLPGHGTDPRDLNKVTEEELLRFVDRAYSELKAKYEEVVLVGMSLGAALSVIVASNRPENHVDRLVLVAPYFRLKYEWYYLVPAEAHARVARAVVPYFKRPFGQVPVYRKEARPHIVSYGYTSSKFAKVALEIAREAQKDLAKIDARTPVLVLHSKKDRVSDYKTAIELVGKIKAPVRFVSLERSNHILLWDYDAPQVEREILEFLTDSRRG